MDYELEKKIPTYIYNEEVVITYEGPNDESLPAKIDLMNGEPTKYNPFNYLCLPIRKLVSERREYEISVKYYRLHNA